MGRHSTTRQASASSSLSRPRLGARLLGNYCPCRRRRCCCPFRRRAANGITSAFALSLKLRKLSINMRGQASINPPHYTHGLAIPHHIALPRNMANFRPGSAADFYAARRPVLCSLSLSLSLSVRLHGKPEASLS